MDRTGPGALLVKSLHATASASPNPETTQLRETILDKDREALATDVDAVIAALGLGEWP